MQLPERLFQLAQPTPRPSAHGPAEKLLTEADTIRNERVIDRVITQGQRLYAESRSKAELKEILLRDQMIGFLHWTSPTWLAENLPRRAARQATVMTAKPIEAGLRTRVRLGNYVETGANLPVLGRMIAEDALRPLAKLAVWASRSAH